MPPSFTIIIPTRNRAAELAQLFLSLAQLEGLADLRPEIIVCDDNSHDESAGQVAQLAAGFPCAVKTIKARGAGKSAALNKALQVARGDALSFLDDDVVVDPRWLITIEQFRQAGSYQAGQGKILLQSPAVAESSVQMLLQRYRTIPYIDFGADVREVHSLNGANFVIGRELLQSLGGFDERLGPGASGTSEDVELARRIAKAGYKIGYMRDATVYHNVDPARLTEAYFKQIHRRQGASRWLINEPGRAQIWYDLSRASLGYFYYRCIGQERKYYRNKGRIYHYLGMLEEKRRPKPAR